MPCDGKNPNCDRRRELLAQLKCLISSMDRKKPCEWDEPSCPPVVYCSEEPSCTLPFCRPVKPSKSFDFRASIMYRCECIKRNGLQDRCMMWDCMGRPECMTKLYPVCEPGRAALLKLTDLGDVEVALRKFYCADQARETALAAYCKLVCDDARWQKTLPCNKDKGQNIETCCASPKSTRGHASYDNSSRDSWCKSTSCGDQSPYRVYVPSPAYPTNCYIPQRCYTYSTCPPCEPVSPRNSVPPPTCSPFCPPPVCLSCIPCCPAI